MPAADRPQLPPRRWALKLGEPFGIAVHVHATFLILIAWVALAHVTKGSGLMEATGAVLVTLSVFAIVVVHELAHALTARRFGIHTRDIVLYPIGGVASLDRAPEKPAQELLVALAGPAVNLSLAALLYGAIQLFGGPAAEWPQIAAGSFAWTLLWINLSLGAFNLIPAFPMDGGRVLRALLAMRMGRVEATVIAARIGRLLALPLAAAGLYGSPMLVVIAAFVWLSAQREASAVQVRAALAELPVERAMITEFAALAPSDTLDRAVALTLAGFQRDFPVVEERRLVGLLTGARVVAGLTADGPGARVSKWMAARVPTADRASTLDAAVDRIEPGGPSTVVVVTPSGAPEGLLIPENIAELLVLRAAESAKPKAA